MKRLATVIAAAASLAIAAPVFACPNMDHGDETAPRTAEKDKKEQPKEQDKAKAKETDKAKAKETDKAKTAKPVDNKDKKPDKVSSK